MSASSIPQPCDRGARGGSTGDCAVINPPASGRCPGGGGGRDQDAAPGYHRRCQRPAPASPGVRLVFAIGVCAIGVSECVCVRVRLCACVVGAADAGVGLGVLFEDSVAPFFFSFEFSVSFTTSKRVSNPLNRHKAGAWRGTAKSAESRADAVGD